MILLPPLRPQTPFQRELRGIALEAAGRVAMWYLRLLAAAGILWLVYAFTCAGDVCRF